MLLLLPPSETKRDGGSVSPLELAALSFPELGDARRVLVDALLALSHDAAGAAQALGLSARAAPAELDRNRALRSAPTMPAIERYTGVLYDALAIEEASALARARAREHVVIHSALFGLVGADDPIPAYRLSHDSRLPGLRLRAHWAAANAAVLAARPGPIVDLRSEGYVALGPLPERPDAVIVRVVAIGDDGVARALNHFNKKGKGEYVRALLAAGDLPETIEELCEASTALGWPLRRLAPGVAGQHPSSAAGADLRRELELVVPGTLPPRP